MSINRVKKIWCIYTQWSIIKNNKLMPFSGTWIDLESVILNEVCQTEKKNYPMAPVIYGI